MAEVCSVSMNPEMIDSGVLSSWLAFATKSDCIFSIFIDLVRS